jgi:hypothetical protein
VCFNTYGHRVFPLAEPARASPRVFGPVESGWQ